MQKKKDDMTILAIIPARGGSKGIKNKNLRLVHQKPLIEWSILQALASPHIDRVIVSTDSEAIAEVSRQAGADVPALRPDHLAQDETPTEPVMLHALEAWGQLDDSDAVMLLQPTSPLRLPGSLDKAIRQFREEDADSLLSVCPSHAFFWKNPAQPQALYDYQHRPRRQDIKPSDTMYRETGSVYITKAGILRSTGNRLGGKISMFSMQEEESLEIDSEVDLMIIEKLMEQFF